MSSTPGMRDARWSCRHLVTIFLAWACAAMTPLTDSTAQEVQPVFPARGSSQRPSRIDPPLADYMKRAGDGERISVVLLLERQLTADARRALLSDPRARDKRERRRLLIAELKRIAQTDQAGLLRFLNAAQRREQVRNVRSLWLTNAIGVTAPKAIIQRLTAFSEIRSIYLDIPRPVKGAPAWGVTQIRADQVWALVPTGYNGTGVTVGILDTGVDYDHPDLVNRMWINTPEDIDNDGRFTAADNNGIDEDGNGFIDDVVGWNFSGAGNNNPDDVNGHGTHVAGTVAGDGTGGTATGVAPGARIMALREASSIALSTQQECWAGMQYALANGADLINFSSGWLDTWAPMYATWRNNITTLMDGGVLFVTIAHNDANTTGAPNNVRTPGRVPLAVTVGATDNADAIAAFSNNGPVTWQTVAPFFDYPWPPGLLKPDVSAPGVNVNSTTMGGGYSGNTWSGTSMAAPHVAGLAALLLDEDPSLTPYQLKFLLEETAVDLGAAGADNVFGWGRIDALAAINYTISPTPYDLAVTGTTSLWTSTDLWVDNNDDGTPDTPAALSNNHLYARIRNLGGQVVSNVEVKFYYADVATIGISGFDPNGDGDPADGNFTYIGSYRIPTLGPSGSNHGTAIALVNWNIPVPPGDHWCVGIGIVASNPPNAPEGNTSNNTAFKNFFDITLSAAAFNFHIAPPPSARQKPFGVEIVRRNVPKEASVELVIDRALEKRIIVEAEGVTRMVEALLDSTHKPLGAAYFRVLEREVRHVRYSIDGDRAVLRGIVSPQGEALPVRIVVRLPAGVPVNDEMLIIISTLDQQSARVGGITLRLTRSRRE